MQVEEGYKRLLAEVGSAQRLRDRAQESLAVSEPRQGHGQALTSAAQVPSSMHAKHLAQ